MLAKGQVRALQRGHINLCTLRHDPGRLMYVMRGHNGRPVSGLSLQHDEMGFFSAGWDGSALVRRPNC